MDFDIKYAMYMVSESSESVDIISTACTYTFHCKLWERRKGKERMNERTHHIILSEFVPTFRRIPAAAAAVAV